LTENDNFICASSAADSGSHACEVWVHKKMPRFDPKIKGKVSIENCSIIFQEPRILIVRCLTQHVDCYFVSAHAPYPGCKEDPSSWWTHFVNVIHTHCVKTKNVICGIDGNTIMYGSNSLWGSLNSCKSNKSIPQYFESVEKSLTSLQFSVVNSFAENTVDGSSYQSYQPTAGGDSKLIDYILTSPSVSAIPNSFCSLKDFPIVKYKEDHWPVYGGVIVCSSAGANIVCRRKKKFDPAKFQDVHNYSMFVDHINSIPWIPYNVDLTSHRHILDTYILDGLCECFPIDKFTKRKDYISDVTFKHILACEKARRFWFKNQSHISRAPMHAAFMMWTNRCWKVKWHSIVYV